MPSYLFDRYRHGALMASGVMVTAKDEHEALHKAKKLNVENAGPFEERLKLRSIRPSPRDHYIGSPANSLTHRSEWE